MVQLKRAALYVRVSTDDQDCQRQENDLRAYCQRAGFEITSIYKETASGGKTDRAERKKVLELARARKIDAVIVTELSRWSRDTEDLIHTLKELTAYNVSCIAQTGLQCDLSTPMGSLMVTMLAGFAEFERNVIRERTKSGIATARANGKKIGRQKGQQVRPHPLTQQILDAVELKVPYRTIAEKLGISKTTVVEVVRKNLKTA